MAKLVRELSVGMLSMIAIGGSIGTGIFLASGHALYVAGPGGTLLAYVITGIMAFFLMMSLGEMAAFMPVEGSFAAYATRFVDPAFGYALAWNYWYSWAITVAAEMAAAALIMQFWFPNSIGFAWSMLFLSGIIFCNAISTHAFGLAEYWFSVLKVAVILMFIAVGLALAFGLTPIAPIGFTHWREGDAPFHGGFFALLPAFLIAGFSFQGTELIGIAAAESANPKRDVPRAVKHIFWRILLFFVLSIFVISLLISHTAEQLTGESVLLSPFTLTLKQIGISFAASLMNAVVLIAILSTGNSGMYGATRMLWHLAEQGHLPVFFAKLNSKGVPQRALLLTSAVVFIAYLSSFYGNGSLYLLLLNAAAITGFIAWMGISVCHYRFRKAYLAQGRDLSALPFLAKGFPFSTAIVLLLCSFIILGQNYQAFLANTINWYDIFLTYAGVPIFFLIWFGYKWIKKTRWVKLHEASFEE